MIEFYADGHVTVTAWIHPGTMKMHIREDCKASRALLFNQRPSVLSFSTVEEAQDWWHAIGSDESETCRWCFPTERAPGPETESERAPLDALSDHATTPGA
jgi:hypothetical protein